MVRPKILEVRLPGLFTFLLFCLFIQTRALGQSNDDPSRLKPYLSCKFEDELKIVETSRHRQWTSSEKFRTVEIKGVVEKVSLVYRYLVMVPYPHTYFFPTITS